MTAATASRAGGPSVPLAVAIGITVFLASLAPVVSATGSEWPGFKNDAKGTGLQTGKDLPNQLDIVWQIHLSGQVKASPIVGDGLVFIGTDEGNVYGLDARNGKPLWGPVKLAEPVIGTPAYENDRLYVATSKLDGSAGKIYVLNAGTGSFIMNVTLEKGSYAGPAIHDGKLFVGHDGGKMVAFDTETMTKLWEFSTAVTVKTSTIPEDGYGRDNCCTKTNIAAKPVKTVPIVTEGRVYFSSFNHQFFAVSSGGNPGAETTTMHYVENLNDIVYSSAAVGRAKHMSKDMVVVGSYDGRLYAYATEPLGSVSSCPSVSERLYHPVGNDCAKRIYWIHNTGSRIFASPAIANHRAYVGDEGGTFRAVWLESGNEAWSYKTGNTIRSSAAVLNNTIVVGSYDGKLYMFKEDDKGKLLEGYPKTVALSDKIHSSPAIAGGKVFVATQDGILYALAAPGTEVPPGGPADTPIGDPDYSLKDLVLTPRKAVAGQPLEVTVAVHNSGGNAGPVSVRLYNGEALLDEIHVEVPGGTAKVHSFVITPQAGDLFLRMVVDENGTSAEDDETNNVLEQHHVVEAAGQPPAADGADGETGDGESAGGEEEDEAVPTPPVALIVVSLALLAMAVRRVRRD